MIDVTRAAPSGNAWAIQARSGPARGWCRNAYGGVDRQHAGDRGEDGMIRRRRRRALDVATPHPRGGHQRADHDRAGEEHRELGQHGRPAGQAEPHGPPGVGPRQVGVHGQEQQDEAERRGDVRLHDAPVSQDGRLEAEERHREERGPPAEQPAREDEEYPAERDGQGDRAQPRAERDVVEPRAVGVPEMHVMPEPPGGRRRSRLHAAGLEPREIERQERQPGDDLDERRVLVNEVEVAVQVVVGRGDQHGLVDRDALARDDRDHRRGHHEEEQRDGREGQRRPTRGRGDRVETHLPNRTSSVAARR